MNYQQGHCVNIKSDEDVNKIIKWWNDRLFEQGYVQMDDMKENKNEC